MGTLLALLPSPLLGPATWLPAADALTRLGWETVIPPVPPQAPRTGDDVMRAFLAALPADRDLVLVPHSNAGLYVPALTSQRRVTGYVFVDAGLPTGGATVPLAPPAFQDFLREKADRDGLLPRWTSWWDESDVAALFPNAGARDPIEREQQRLPLSYFLESLPVPPGWDERPGAYLAFGDTYDSERKDAAARGWPVATLPGQHLHTVVAPEQVAAEIDALLTAIGVRPERALID